MNQKRINDTLPDIKLFSPRNLRYMNSFYKLYADITILPQVDAEFETKKNFMIPWGHNKVIIIKQFFMYRKCWKIIGRERFCLIFWIRTYMKDREKYDEKELKAEQSLIRSYLLCYDLVVAEGR